MFATARGKLAGSAAALGLGAFGITLAMQPKVAHASEDVVPAPQFPWNHTSPMAAFDHASIRRGWNVYKTICASCHSMNRLAYRNLVGAVLTEDEAKAVAAEVDVRDGPNDQGEFFDRPGKLSDKLAAPYANEQAARAANNGAYPPDLSLIVKARPLHEDYVFALLTGYDYEPPAGVSIRQGLYYNPYFAGAAIAMRPPLMDGSVDYDDGTPNTLSQMSKDVATFLAWASEPEADDRKLMGIKFITIFSVLALTAFYYKRLKWSTLKNRRIVYRGPQ